MENKSIDNAFGAIAERYNGIISDLGLDLSLENEFAEIKKNISAKAGSEYAASRGEYLNGIVIAALLGYEFIDAATVIVFNEDGSFNNEKTQPKLRDRLKNVERAVIPGFYGADVNGVVRTFSRGGSDVTGSIIASAVKADVYENWTDVSGFLVADPRIVENPKAINVITYKELRELAYMGATVLHEDAIFPVRAAGIPINIKNTNVPEDPGTMIVSEVSEDEFNKYTITGIAGKKGFAAINIEKAMMNSELGFCRKVLEVLERNGISIEHMPSGIDTLSLIFPYGQIEGKEDEVIAQIRKAVAPDHIELEKGIAILAVIKISAYNSSCYHTAKICCSSGTFAFCTYFLFPFIIFFYIKFFQLFIIFLCNQVFYQSENHDSCDSQSNSGNKSVPEIRPAFTGIYRVYHA